MVDFLLMHLEGSMKYKCSQACKMKELCVQSQACGGVWDTEKLAPFTQTY